jgi:hypothetical protein
MKDKTGQSSEVPIISGGAFITAADRLELDRRLAIKAVYEQESPKDTASILQLIGGIARQRTLTPAITDEQRAQLRLEALSDPDLFR